MSKVWSGRNAQRTGYDQFLRLERLSEEDDAVYRRITAEHPGDRPLKVVGEGIPVTVDVTFSGILVAAQPRQFGGQGFSSGFGGLGSSLGFRHAKGHEYVWRNVLGGFPFLIINEHVGTNVDVSLRPEVLAQHGQEICDQRDVETRLTRGLHENNQQYLPDPDTLSAVTLAALSFTPAEQAHA